MIPSILDSGTLSGLGWWLGPEVAIGFSSGSSILRGYLISTGDAGRVVAIKCWRCTMLNDDIRLENDLFGGASRPVSELSSFDASGSSLKSCSPCGDDPASPMPDKMVALGVGGSINEIPYMETDLGLMSKNKDIHASIMEEDRRGGFKGSRPMENPLPNKKEGGWRCWLEQASDFRDVLNEDAMAGAPIFNESRNPGNSIPVGIVDGFLSLAASEIQFDFGHYLDTNIGEATPGGNPNSIRPSVDDKAVPKDEPEPPGYWIDTQFGSKSVIDYWVGHNFYGNNTGRLSNEYFNAFWGPKLDQLPESKAQFPIYDHPFLLAQQRNIQDKLKRVGNALATMNFAFDTAIEFFDAVSSGTGRKAGNAVSILTNTMTHIMFDVGAALQVGIGPLVSRLKQTGLSMQSSATAIDSGDFCILLGWFDHEEETTYKVTYRSMWYPRGDYTDIVNTYVDVVILETIGVYLCPGGGLRKQTTQQPKGPNPMAILNK